MAKGGRGVVDMLLWRFSGSKAYGLLLSHTMMRGCVTPIRMLVNSIQLHRSVFFAQPKLYNLSFTNFRPYVGDRHVVCRCRSGCRKHVASQRAIAPVTERAAWSLQMVKGSP